MHTQHSEKAEWKAGFIIETIIMNNITLYICLPCACWGREYSAWRNHTPHTCTFCTFRWAGDPAPRTPCRRASSPCAWRSRAASVSWTHSDHIGTFCSEPGVFVVRGIYFPLTVWHWNTRKLGEREQVKNEIKGDERNKFPRSQLKVHGKNLEKIWKISQIPIALHLFLVMK